MSVSQFPLGQREEHVYHKKAHTAEIRECESQSVISSSCLTLCNPMDCSPPCSSVHGILQARILVWVATLLSSRSLNPGIKPGSPALQTDSLPSQPPRIPN